MNILLTCAGRRNFSVRAFQDAVNGRGLVFACDSDPDAPALTEADQAFMVPGIDDPEYIDALLSICRQHRVGLLVPALEPELPLVARHRARFLNVGTLPLISTSAVVDTCFDKLAAAAFLATLGIASPKSSATLEEARSALSSGELTFPLIVKPRWGVSSIGLELCGDDEELELAYRLVGRRLHRTFLAKFSAGDPGRSVLIQERLEGPEYGFDIVNDLRGKYVCSFVRKKLRMHSGQTDRAVAVVNPAIERVTRRIGESLGHFGTLDGDLMLTRDGIVVLDLNPRLGGGYPFSHVAGANIPAALVAWACNEPSNPAWFQVRPEVAISRVDELVIIRDEGRFKEGLLEVQHHGSAPGL
jgi:carbamoyl-phosphate synthase large subunit